MTEESSRKFQSWYQKNKATLSERRKRRYRDDPAYRAIALARARNYRREHAEAEVPEGYSTCFQDAADKLGVSIWTLREWRRKNYFPEPELHRGRLWFSDHQVALLHHLKTFLDQQGPRMKDAAKKGLELVRNSIYANWK